MGIEVPEEADPRDGISLSKAEFLDGIAVMRKVGFPIGPRAGPGFRELVRGTRTTARSDE
jgi:hypothetical protein